MITHVSDTPLLWRKSSRSGHDGNCVEVAYLPTKIAVRDSKHPHGPALFFSHEIWSLFLADVKNGRFNLN